MLAKHVGMYKGAFVTTTGNIYNVATQLADAVKQGNAILTVIFNFTRDSEQHKVYQAIEQLKDGLVTSQEKLVKPIETDMQQDYIQPHLLYFRYFNY